MTTKKLVWLLTRAKIPDIFGKLNNPPVTILKPEKKEHVRVNLDVVVVKFHLASNIPV
jgi:hypothetical protein